jgi:flagellar transcriptional activator FlhD
MLQDQRDLVTALNLYILQIIAQIARDDLADACLRFGIGEDVARELASLNPAQLFEISRSPRFFFSVDEGLIRASMKDMAAGNGYGRMHKSITDITQLIQRGEQDE